MFITLPGFEEIFTKLRFYWNAAVATARSHIQYSYIYHVDYNIDYPPENYSEMAEDGSTVYYETPDDMAQSSSIMGIFDLMKGS